MTSKEALKRIYESCAVKMILGHNMFEKEAKIIAKDLEMRRQTERKQ